MRTFYSSYDTNHSDKGSPEWDTPKSVSSNPPQGSLLKGPTTAY